MFQMLGVFAERGMFVMHLHAQTVRGLRNLGNREAGLGRQPRAVDDQDAALKHLARRLVGVVRVLETPRRRALVASARPCRCRIETAPMHAKIETIGRLQDSVDHDTSKPDRQRLLRLSCGRHAQRS
jgi:hypothetical protein